MRILLLCSAGMSTSLLVLRMQEVAIDKKIEAHIWSKGSNDYDEKDIEKADVLLVGPQLRFLVKRIREEANGKPVRVIDMMTYGRMDGERALDLAIQALKEIDG